MRSQATPGKEPLRHRRVKATLDATMSVQGGAERIRRAFARAAPRYDAVSRVYDEIGRRLLTHLDPVTLEPALIVDVGCGTGTGASLLAARYRRARVCAVDCAWPMLETARSKAPRLFSRQSFVCGWAAHLPLRDRCANLVHANLLLPWCRDPQAPLREFVRVLAPGGLLLLSSLGPDTLVELRRIWAREEEPPPEPGLLDMHVLGDALVAAGLVEPVMETERLTVQYRSAASVIDDLVRSGAWAARDRRGARRRAPEPFAERRRRYLGMRSAAPLDVTVEIVYAHAWAPAPMPGQSFVSPPIPVRRDSSRR